MRRAARGFVYGVRGGELSALAQSNTHLSSLLLEASKRPGFKGKSGDVELVWKGETPAVLVGLGDASEEDVRKAAASGVKALRTKAETIAMEPLGGHARATGEGATLGSYVYEDLKREKDRSPAIQVEALDEESLFQEGRVIGQAQNLARELADTPANLMTPSLFVERLQRELPEGLEAIVRDEDWAREQRMGAFLSVTRGSSEPLRFLELVWKPNMGGEFLSYVGKGVTFDAGGYSIKPSAGMSEMKGDMGGAAAVASALVGIARLKLAHNVSGVIPLCENLINGHATKPGDVVTSRAGLTIEVDNTDAEGRMLLADALDYTVETYKPRAVIDVATLTGAMVVALGDACVGSFVTDDDLWERLHQAGEATGETMWRMPMLSRYGELMKSEVADLINAGTSRQAGSCTAAAFLARFVPEKQPYAHLDIAGVMNKGFAAYHPPKGMTGVPTRTLIQLAKSYLQ